MGSRQVVEGALPPLFERLRFTVNPDEVLPLRAYTPRELRESVRHELEGLLNTRSVTPPDIFAVTDLTVLDYGLPDLTDYSPGNVDDRRKLARLLARAITAYEPRLREVQVQVEAVSDRPDGLLATMDAVLTAGTFTERMIVTASLSTGSRAHQVTLQPVEEPAAR